MSATLLVGRRSAEPQARCLSKRRENSENNCRLIQTPFGVFGEGMRFVREAVLKNSDAAIAGWTESGSPLALLVNAEPAGGLSGDARETRSGVTLRFCE